MSKAFDPVENPVHYAGDGKIACMDALQSMMSRAQVRSDQAYWWGCAFKYLWRWPLKNGIEDIRKAARCLEYLEEAVLKRSEESDAHVQTDIYDFTD